MANEDIKISELPNGLVDEDSLFPTAQPDGLGDFSTAKISTTDIGNYVATEQQYSDLGGKTLVQAISSAGGGGDLEDLDDVTITNPSDGDTIVYDATQQVWVNGQGSVVGDLDDLTDVDLSTPTNGQVLTYDATQQVWVNATPTASASDLGDLGDVTFITPAERQCVTYDNANDVWINRDVVKPMAQSDYDNLPSAKQQDGTLYITDGTPPSETVTGSDVLYFSDVSDSNKPKSTTAADLAALGMPAITDITSDYCTTSTGVSLEVNDSSVYKQGKHIWGNLQFVIPSTTSQQVIAVIASGFQPAKTIIGYAGYSGSKWSIDTIGGLYIGTNQNIACTVSVSGKTYVNIVIDYLTA